MKKDLWGYNRILNSVVLKAITVFVVAFLLSPEARATEPPKDLWQGLIGEAVSEGYEGMYAVACVYKNRINKGMSLGCVALKRKDLNQFIKKQGVKYERMAKSIIEKVFYQNAEDITKGAIHYENIERFGIPYWAKDMIITCKIRNHTFYKRR